MKRWRLDRWPAPAARSPPWRSPRRFMCSRSARRRSGSELDTSHVVLDRDGRLLRAYATPEGRWRLPATVEDVDPRFLKLLFAYEDKRFYAPSRRRSVRAWPRRACSS